MIWSTLSLRHGGDIEAEGKHEIVYYAFMMLLLSFISIAYGWVVRAT